MKSKFIIPLTVALLLVSCGTEEENPNTPEPEEPEDIVEVEPAIKINKQNGHSYNLIGEIPAQYINTIDDPTTENNEIAEFMFPNQNSSATIKSKIKLSWDFEGDIVFPVKLNMYSDSELTNLITSYDIPKITKKTLYITNPIPCETTYYQLVDSAPTPHKSEVDSYKFDCPVRAIYTYGEISNMRDLGGWKTHDGQSINYGKIYRCASTQSMGDDSHEILKDLGIKSEIDVRFEHAEREHSFTDINFVNYGLTDNYSLMTTDETTKENIKNIFDYLSNEENYPLMYHCSAGADRTGFASLLIEGALGIEDESIYKDYELTTFYLERRLRANIIENNGIYKYDPSGAISGFYSTYSFSHIITKGLKKYFDGSGKISDAVKNYLIQECGVTENTINLVKNILLSK